MDKERLYKIFLKAFKKGDIAATLTVELSKKNIVNRTEHILELIKVIVKIIENEGKKKHIIANNIVDATKSCCKSLLFTSKEMAYLDDYFVNMLIIFYYLNEKKETSLIFELSKYMNLFEPPITEIASSLVVRYYKYIIFILKILSKHYNSAIFRKITDSSIKWVKLYGNSNKVYQAVNNILPNCFSISVGKDNSSLQYFIDNILQCLSEIRRSFTDSDLNNSFEYLMDLLMHFYYVSVELKDKSYIGKYISSFNGRINSKFDEFDIVKSLVLALFENPSDIDSDCLRTFDTNLKLLETSDSIIKHHCLSSIFKCIKYYIQKYLQTKTPSCVKADFITEISKILFTLAEMFKQTRCLRSQCSGCKLEFEHHSALHALALIRPMCIAYMPNKSSNSNQVLEVLIDSYKERFDLIMTLRDKRCPSATLNWNNLCIEQYNTFVANSSNKFFYQDIKGTELLVRNYNTIKEHLKESKQSHQCVQHAYIVLTNRFESLNDERALLLCLLRVIDSNFNTQVCKWYVSIKFKLKDFYHITWYDLLNKYNDFYEMDVSKIDYKELCLKEVEMYYSFWRNPESLTAICKTGLSVSKDPVFCAKLCVLGQPNKMTNVEFNKMVVATEKRLEALLSSADNKEMSNMLLGSLTYLRYLIEINILQEENKLKKTPLLKKVDSDILNERLEDDTCLVIHIDEFVNIVQEKNILNHLKKSYKHWNDSCHNIKKLNELNEQIVTKTLGFMEIAAKSFSLHNYQLDEIQMWKLIYEISKTLNNHQYLINAASHLIKMAGHKSKFVDSIVNYCYNIATDLMNNINAKEKQYILHFWLSIAHYSYKCNDNKFGYVQLMYVDFMLHKDEDYSRVVEARLQWLKAMFMSARSVKSMGLNTIDSNIASYTESYNLVLSAVSIPCSSTSDQLTLKLQVLETTINLARVFLRLCIHRPAYFYLKTAVEYAKRYAVAKRMAEILCLLAHTDLLTENVEDCQFKLDELKGILGLENIVAPQIDKPQISGPLGNLLNVSISLSPQSQMIDCSPASKYKGSPALSKTKFKMPDFIQHANSCTCLYCCSPPYHMLVLETVHVEAQINALSFNYETSRHYFKTCDTLYDFFVKKLEYFKDDLLFTTRNRLSVIYSRCQLDYALLLRKNNKKVLAQRLIKNILKLQEALLLEDIELLQQVLSLDSAFTFEFPINDESNKDNYYLDPSAAYLANCLKTPNQPIRTKITNQIQTNEKDISTPDVCIHLNGRKIIFSDNNESNTPKPETITNRKFFKTPRLISKIKVPIVITSETGTDKCKTSSSSSDSTSHYWTPVDKSNSKASDEVFYTPQSNTTGKKTIESSNRKVNPSSVRKKAIKNTMKLIFEEQGDTLEKGTSEIVAEISNKIQTISLNDNDISESKEEEKNKSLFLSPKIEKSKGGRKPLVADISSSSSDEDLSILKNNLRKTRLRKELSPVDQQKTITTRRNKYKQESVAIAAAKVNSTPILDNDTQKIPNSSRRRKKIPRNPFVL